jgi:hypothetical protein
MKRVAFFICVAALLVGLPLVGVLYSGEDISDYTEFPPLTLHVPQSPFSWAVFCGMTLLVLAVTLPFEIHALRTRAARSCPLNVRPPHPDIPLGRFPLWGWGGLLIIVVGWFLAWTRFAWFASFQKFTFSPIWIGYIVLVNALTFRRRGKCLLTEEPVYLLKLFVVSAVFWWFFEYLNRFVQNWEYVGIDDISPLEYFIFATLPFSTVLPAVISTAELLGSFQQSAAGMEDFVRINLRRRRMAAVVILLISTFGLAAIARWPDALFPLLWVAPLLIITSLQTLIGEPTIFTPVRDGNWRRIYLMACAALICGFFWELWNFGSVAKWIYNVPYVNRFKIFEMPVLGFAGYLPFGLECAVVADLVKSAKR